MPDDTCGWDTPNGPCQNPPTEGNYCWIPSHGDADADNPHGRDFALSEDDHEDVLQAARDGMSKAGCARAAGVDEKSLERYLDAHPDFRRAFTQARAAGERKLVKGALYRDTESPRQINDQHARFLLSTSFDYVKTERTEVTGEDGGSVDVSLKREVVDSGDGD